MASIDKRTKTLFFTTSPRSPMKMVPEIKLLTDKFTGKRWSRNPELQKDFMLLLFDQDFFESSARPKDPAFSARDRITRAPKALGFVDLDPVIKLTSAGRELVYGEAQGETLLRQLMKFQLPSPYHTQSHGSSQVFFVKPYLEMLRLLRHFGSLSFDEIMLFCMQLTDYRKFDKIVDMIDDFRRRKAMNKGKYKKFIAEEKECVVRNIYSKEIESNDGFIGNAKGFDLQKFIKTKIGNLRDYTDACFRYLRATEIVGISQRWHSLYILPDRIKEVDYLLATISPEPHFVDKSEQQLYKEYLFNAETPKLLTDNPKVLTERIHSIDTAVPVDSLSIIELKSLDRRLRRGVKEKKLNVEIAQIKERKRYEDIQETFDSISKGVYYDNPLMFEWNTWRAMTMIDGGNIVPNFNIDDDGKPVSTAAGNRPDILCDYGDFSVLVEVTLQSGQKQYDNEGEPIARHLGKVKRETGKDAFCLFIAPTINQSAISFFYSLHDINIAFYGGKSVIVPMELGVYRKMLEDSYKHDYIPNSRHIKTIFEKSKEFAKNARDENEWYEKITNYSINWLKA